MAAGSYTQQQLTLRKRLPFVYTVMVIASLGLLLRLVWFQSPQDPRTISYLETMRDANYRREQRLPGERGNIYDRNGQPLAVNSVIYEIGLSPNLISDPTNTAVNLAFILGLNEDELLEQIRSDTTWVLLGRNYSAEVGQQVAQLDILGVRVNPMQARRYPQGTLAAQVIGFVAESADGIRGYYGIEGYYEDQLAGRISTEEVSNIPFDIAADAHIDNQGNDLVLTIDREIQFLVESELERAVTETGATGGTILVMNPRNGDILAMSSYPSFDPSAVSQITDERLLGNPAISDQYEPGSVMKVVTVAAALERGVITPEWTYNDQGRLEVGGQVIQNWDRNAYGAVNTTQLLVNSLNVGAATISTQMMGPNMFYEMMGLFGFGQATGIDLQGEAGGTLFVPGDANWSESNLATNSFGQGIAVTPLQMITSVAAIANGGLMMQPRIVYQIIDGTDVITSQPTVLSRPISAQTATTVTNMMVSVVNDGLDGNASLAGYSIAGKTGTAEIATPLGYESDTSIASFIGFFPADDPQVIVLIKLDRPAGYWGTEVAAPVFHRLAERLVILLEIPPDDVRHALAAQGGSVNDISR